MEAPEKIYFTSTEDGTHYYTEGIPFEREYIEYIRTDAFIEKAKKFINTVNQYLYYCISEGCDLVDVDKFIEDFKNYIKG